MNSKGVQLSVVGGRSSVIHQPVLLQESVEGLNLKPGKILLDGTLGLGGHTRFALEMYPGLRAVGIDRDATHLKALGKELGIETKVSNFAELDEALASLGVGKVDAILLDLGFSSDQLENAGRGLSFLREEPLDMRLSGEGFTAADILNNWDVSAIELILKGFGEERYARRIAEGIGEFRRTKPFETTSELVAVIEASVPGAYRHGRINPATRTFQALRMAVNEELPNLEKGLARGFEALNPGGRFAVISFHSLEDRIVKNFFREKAQEGLGELITKKPLVASEAETAENPRSRSAKLRIIQKL